MTTTQDHAVPAAPMSRPEIDGVQTRKTRAVMFWAGTGIFWLGLTVYAWGKWLIDGHNTPGPVGPTEIPGWQKFAARGWEVFFAVIALWVIWHFLVQPWRRERRLTLDGMLVIAWPLAWAIQDPLINYSRQMFNYNSAFINFGCPQCHLPGWQSPGHAQMTEPIIFMGAMYIGILFGGTVLACGLMRKAKQRWSQLGTAGLIMIAFGAMFIADVVLEIIWLRFGLYHYGGAIKSVTLFHGHYYQYPIYEGVLWGGCWAALACLRYFRNDKGETIAERGIDEVRAAPKQKQGVRLLAVIGCVSTLFLIYNIPIQWFATHADNFPQEILDRSYLTNTMCGLGTDQACPGPRVPMPVGPDSAHATPEGDFEAPAGLPVQVGR